MKLHYWLRFDMDEEDSRGDLEDPEGALESAVSQVSHLSTFQFMAQKDFKVNIEAEIWNDCKITAVNLRTHAQQQ